jgi:hypothetical protein
MVPDTGEKSPWSVVSDTPVQPVPNISARHFCGGQVYGFLREAGTIVLFFLSFEQVFGGFQQKFLVGLVQFSKYFQHLFFVGRRRNKHAAGSVEQPVLINILGDANRFMFLPVRLFLPDWIKDIEV